jgi:hypothetical protein
MIIDLILKFFLIMAALAVISFVTVMIIIVIRYDIEERRRNRVHAFQAGERRDGNHSCLR